MKKIIALTALSWIILIGLSFLWNYTSLKNERCTIVFKTARVLFEQIIITRRWNANTGGVYATVSEKLKPNPYLVDPRRDIIVDTDFHLTKINPSYMTRQLSELADNSLNIRFHLTSLQPMRPLNAPNEWERKLLERFNQGISEHGEIIKDKATESFIYMKPLKVEKSCLRCHISQNYKEGDIIGGLSIKLFDIPKIKILPDLFGHLTTALIGLILILVFGFKLKKAYQTIQHQARYDALTRIPNRRFFNEKISREYTRCRRNGKDFSFIICDIDNFKDYNDTYGHKEGDECLKKVADVLKNHIKRPADLCARYGGEEFVVVLPDTDQAGAHHLAERIRHGIEEMKIINKASKISPYVTISLGGITNISSKYNVEDMIKKADNALYRAKNKGKNRIEFD